MASIFGHALLGLGLAKFMDRKSTFKVLSFAMLCTVIPDADVLAFPLGLPYEHPLGHRGFSHSILFAFLFALFIVKLFFKESRLSSGRGLLLLLLFFFSTLSHSILDAMTTGGLGVGYLIPFHNERYFFGWRPIQVSPIGISNFFSEWGLRVIKSEVVWIGIPAALLYSLGLALNRGKKSKHKTNSAPANRLQRTDSSV